MEEKNTADPSESSKSEHILHQESISTPPPKIVLGGRIKCEYEFNAVIKECTGCDVRIENTWATSKLLTKSKSDYERITEGLKANGNYFWTYAPKEERLRRFVIHNLPIDLKPADILQDLQQHLIGIQTVKQMNKKIRNCHKEIIENKLLPVFVITALRKVTMNNFKNIKYICSHRYRIEPFKSNYSVLQCYKCQRFGHKEKYCNFPHRCLYCSQNHSVKECDKTSPKQCSNCKKDHLANYRKCAGRIAFLRCRGKTSSDSDYEELFDYFGNKDLKFRVLFLPSPLVAT